MTSIFKNKITIISILILLVMAAAGLYLYKTHYFWPVQPEWQKLLVFEPKNNTLTTEQTQVFQERFDELKTNLEKNPDNFNSWLALGVVKKGVADYQGAADVWLYATRLSPKGSTPFFNLADVYAYFLNEPQKAEEAINQAIANDPKDINFYLAKADIYRYKFPDGENRYEQTILDALQKFPDDVNLVSALASFYFQTNQKEKAILMYEKLVKLAPDNQAAKQDLQELKNEK